MKLLLCILFFSFYIAGAQNPTDVVTTFGDHPGFDGQINDIAIQPDGKIICIGRFTKYRGNFYNKIVRLNQDGSVDNTFAIGEGFNEFNPTDGYYANLQSVTLQSDGKILVGGFFKAYQNKSCYCIIRLNSNGSIDSTFKLDSGITATSCFDIVIQPDDKIIVVGSLYVPTSRNIIRLNPDGSLDPSFTTGDGFNTPPSSLAVQPDGKIIVGGEFTTFNKVTRNNLIRLNSDGSKDDSFSIGIGFDRPVNGMTLQPDGKVIVYGSFTTYKGLTQRKLVRLLSNGALDDSFNVGTGFADATSAFNQNSPEKVLIDSNGKILIGGSFTAYNGISKFGFVKLLPNGSIDSAATFFCDDYIFSMDFDSSGNVVMGGANFIYRILPNGSRDRSLDYGSGFNNEVTSTLVQPDGKYLVAGVLNKYQMNSREPIIRFNANGTVDASFQPNNIPNGIQWPPVIALQPNGKILFGGLTVVRLNSNGSLDTSFSFAGFGSIGGFEITALAIQTDGKILVGRKSLSGPILTRLNTNGTTDLNFDLGSGFVGTSINSIVIQPDGKILLGGKFSVYKNEPHNNILRLLPNGSVDSTFISGDGFDYNSYNGVRKIVLLPSGKIIVAGYFQSYNSQSAYGIARLNSDGTLDTTFNSGFYAYGVNDIIIQSDGKIVAGGINYYYNSKMLNNFMRFNPDGSIDSTFNPGSGFNGNNESYAAKSTIFYINSLSLFPNGNLLVGGNFYYYNQINSSHLVLLKGGELDLSNQSVNQKKINLYPNPTRNYLNLSGNLADFGYAIFDLTGKKLIENRKNESNSIDVQSLSKGVYFIKVTTNEREFIEKFIKE